MKKLFALVLAIAMIMTCSLAMADRLADIQAAGKLVVATSPDWPPYEYIDDEGNVTGTDVLMVKWMAEQLGVASNNIIIPEIGNVIEMSQDSLNIAGVVPTGGVLVDGLGIGDVGNVVLRDRKHLSQDGLIIVVMAIERDSGTLVSGPDLISRGFVYVRENEDIIESSRELTRAILAEYGRIDGSEWQNMKNRIKDELHRFIYEKIKRNPMILPIIVDLG